MKYVCHCQAQVVPSNFTSVECPLVILECIEKLLLTNLIIAAFLCTFSSLSIITSIGCESAAVSCIVPA